MKIREQREVLREEEWIVSHRALRARPLDVAEGSMKLIGVTWTQSDLSKWGFSDIMDNTHLESQKGLLH